jgi:hypothetical protein
MTSKPTVEEKIGVYRFFWEEEEININVSNIRNGEESPTAELVIRSTGNMAGPHLHQTRLNLLSTPTKKTLAKILGERYHQLEVSWDDVLEDVCVLTLKKIRQGIPAEHIVAGTEVPEQQHLLYPVLPLHQPTVIYGFGGVGKSYFALNCGLVVKNAWVDNPAGLMPLEDSVNMGYLDWETDSGAFQRRVNKLQVGSLADDFSCEYMSMYRPLADDIERIQNFLLDHNIGFLIVDSAAGACGGDMNSAEPVIRMYNALRQLNVTSLIIAHTSKGDGTKKENSIYGSVFFTNYARSVFELKKAQVQGEQGVNIELHHRKSNDTGLEDELRFHMRFTRETVVISKNEDTPRKQERDKKGIGAVYNALREHGALKPEDLARITSDNLGNITVYTHRLKKQGKAQKVDGKWNLLQQNYSSNNITSNIL